MSSPMWQVYRKEIREMFRDKRVRSSAFFGPLFLVFILLMIFGTVFSQLGKRENQKIHVVGSSPMIEVLKASKMNVIPLKDVAEGTELIKKGDARVVLAFPPADLSGQQVVQAYFDPKQQLAQITVSTLGNVFEEANKKALKGVLAAKGLPETAAEAIKLERKEVKVGEDRGASEFILGMLPYLIVIWAFYGGFGVASDLVSGEKEKTTLETLLITPVNRTQIVLGKTLALATVCLISSLSSVLGMVLVSVLNLPGTAVLFKDGLGLTPQSFGVILAVLIPTVLFFASVLVAISTYAKNPREAQTYLTLVSFVVLMPAIFGQFIGLTDVANKMWVNFVPVLNTANNVRMALLGQSSFSFVAVTMAVSLALAGVALYAAIWLFGREQVLTRV